MFDECNTVEHMVLSALSTRWRYIPSEKLGRKYSDAMVEHMGECRLNTFESRNC